MKRIIRHFYMYLIHPLLTADPTPITALLSLLAMWWGVLLGIDSFVYQISLDWFGQGISGVFEKHLPENLWAVLFLTLGLGLLTSRLIRSYKAERAFILTSAMTWAFTAASITKVFPLSLVSGTYIIITLFSIWAYWRISYE